MSAAQREYQRPVSFSPPWCGTPARHPLESAADQRGIRTPSLPGRQANQATSARQLSHRNNAHQVVRTALERGFSVAGFIVAIDPGYSTWVSRFGEDGLEQWTVTWHNNPTFYSQVRDYAQNDGSHGGGNSGGESGGGSDGTGNDDSDKKQGPCKRSVESIREEYAACNGVWACENRVADIARESGMNLPPSAESIASDFLRLITLPIAVLTPQGRIGDTAVGVVSGVTSLFRGQSDWVGTFGGMAVGGAYRRALAPIGPELSGRVGSAVGKAMTPIAQGAYDFAHPPEDSEC